MAPPSGARYETWGIVLETPGPAPSETRAVVTDDDRIVAAIVPDPDAADPAAVLAAVRYWELPPAYVRRLAHAARAPVEEYAY